MGPSGEPLVGRAADLEWLVALLARVRVGSSAALVLSGDVGMGKTHLLRAMVGAADGLRPLVVTGYEGEGGFAFAALHDLVRPLLEVLPLLPAPQRDALQVAFGLDTGPQPNRFLVGLATLSLFAEAARAGPVLVVVDDVQWIDQETLDVLAFVARRPYGAGVGLVMGLRLEGSAPAALSDLPEHRLSPMPEPDMRSLLAFATALTPPPHVSARLVAESEGNPLALLEYAASLSDAQLAGIDDLPPTLPIGERLFARFVTQVASLPPGTRLLLLALAAAGTREADLMAAASRRLGVDRDAALPAVRRGLIGPRPRLAFRHPLIRSVVYDCAEPAARRRVHAALAEAARDLGRVDAAAWHGALAVDGPDEAVAASLEEAAGHAGRRGGYAAEATFLAAAARRTPAEAVGRPRRLLAAARAYINSGNGWKADQILGEAAAAGVPTVTVQAERLHAIFERDNTRSGPETATALAVAANLPDEQDDLARRLLTGAFHAALESRKYTVGATLTQVAHALLQRRAPAGQVTPSELLVDGLATRVAIGHRQATPILRDALDRMSGAPDSAAEEFLGEGSALSVWMAMEDLWNDVFTATTWSRMTSWSVAHGALSTARVGLGALGLQRMRHGGFARAQELFDEATYLGLTFGRDAELMWAVSAEFRAWQGRERETRAMATRMIDFWGGERKFGCMPNFAETALTILELGRGDYAAALGHARSVVEEDPPGHGTRILPDLVEAAVRAGDHAAAERAFDELALRATASGTPWAVGLLSRSRALVLGHSVEAEALFEEALTTFAATPLRTETARTQLLYGEWLRRRRRRAAAREQLTAAAGAFGDMGAALFAKRAARELVALGDSPPAGVHPGRTTLTEQEQRVAELAAAGMTNAEISQRLFLSRSTVDYHLSKVFRKLGIGSRRRLRGAMET